MKKLLIVLGALVVLVVGALVVLPSMVPAERIRQEVVAQVKAQTGRDLAIDGKVSVSAFPSLSVQVANVALSNPPGFQSKDMVRLGALDVQLKLLPILSGRVEVDSFVLIDPVVTLETDRNGKPNWVFDAPPKPKDAKPAAEPAKGGLGDLVLGEVGIQNGRLTYVDGVAATREEVDAINLTVALKSLDQPLAVKGAAKWRGKVVDVNLALANPRALIDGGSTPAEIALGAEPVKLSFKGEASGGKTPGAKGALDVSVPSVRELAGWASGKPLEMAGTGLGPFALKAQLAAGGTKVALTGAEIALDAIKAQGDFAVDTAGTRPSLKGKLAVETLDITPYLPPEQPAKEQKAGPSDWSDAPIDASALKAADVDFALSVGALSVRAIKIDKTDLHLTLRNGRLVADLAQLALYQGAGKGRLMLDGGQAGLGMEAGFALKGLAAEPFLKDAAGFERLEGTGAFDIQVSGRGATERALVSSLDGKGAVTFTDGAIKGINLAEMVRNVTTAFSATSGAQKTDFAELSGTFTIADGILTNRDLALKSPLLRIEGAGTVEMPPRTLHYRVEPKAVASLEGQGGKSDLTGVQVPVIVEGSWDNPSFRPDLAAMVQGQAGQAIKDAIGGKLPGLQPQPAEGQPQPKGPLPLNPGSLFGR